MVDIKKLVEKFANENPEELEGVGRKIAMDLENTAKSLKVSSVIPSDVSFHIINETIDNLYHNKLVALVKNETIQPKQAWAVIYGLTVDALQSLSEKGEYQLGDLKITINETTKQAKN